MKIVLGEKSESSVVAMVTVVKETVALNRFFLSDEMPDEARRGSIIFVHPGAGMDDDPRGTIKERTPGIVASLYIAASV